MLSCIVGFWAVVTSLGDWDSLLILHFRFPSLNYYNIPHKRVFVNHFLQLSSPSTGWRKGPNWASLSRCHCRLSSRTCRTDSFQRCTRFSVLRCSSLTCSAVIVIIYHTNGLLSRGFLKKVIHRLWISFCSKLWFGGQQLPCQVTSKNATYKRLLRSDVSSPFAGVASWYSAPQLALLCASGS